VTAAKVRAALEAYAALTGSVERTERLDLLTDRAHANAALSELTALEELAEACRVLCYQHRGESATMERVRGVDLVAVRAALAKLGLDK
jgi:hypothetical protein